MGTVNFFPFLALDKGFQGGQQDFQLHLRVSASCFRNSAKELCFQDFQSLLDYIFVEKEAFWYISACWLLWELC